MRLPARMLTSRATILDKTAGPVDDLGQSAGEVWLPRPDVLPCAHFPAGERVQRQAELKGVRVSRELYVPSVNLNPQTTRVRVDGSEYAVTLSNEWDGFTVAGLVGV